MQLPHHPRRSSMARPTRYGNPFSPRPGADRERHDVHDESSRAASDARAARPAQRRRSTADRRARRAAGVWAFFGEAMGIGRGLLPPILGRWRDMGRELTAEGSFQYRFHRGLPCLSSRSCVANIETRLRARDDGPDPLPGLRISRDPQTPPNEMGAADHEPPWPVLQRIKASAQ